VLSISLPDLDSYLPPTEQALDDLERIRGFSPSGLGTEDGVPLTSKTEESASKVSANTDSESSRKLSDYKSIDFSIA
jgi:hypothetical protein